MDQATLMKTKKGSSNWCIKMSSWPCRAWSKLWICLKYHTKIQLMWYVSMFFYAVFFNFLLTCIKLIFQSLTMNLLYKSVEAQFMKFLIFLLFYYWVHSVMKRLKFENYFLCTLKMPSFETKRPYKALFFSLARNIYIYCKFWKL